MFVAIQVEFDLQDLVLLMCRVDCVTPDDAVLVQKGLSDACEARIGSLRSDRITSGKVKQLKYIRGIIAFGRTSKGLLATDNTSYEATLNKRVFNNCARKNTLTYIDLKPFGVLVLWRVDVCLIGVAFESSDFHCCGSSQDTRRKSRRRLTSRHRRGHQRPQKFPHHTRVRINQFMSSVKLYMGSCGLVSCT